MARPLQMKQPLVSFKQAMLRNVNAGGVIWELKHVVSVLRAPSESTYGQNTWERERQGACEAERHILTQSRREWFHSTVSLNQGARENNSSQSFVFLNHTA